MVTSHDVAKLAGVSQATVSRALRNAPGTSAVTLRKVRSAAAALGYIPSEAGRILATQRTRRIGIVAGELTNPFYPELIEPMRTELDLLGYRTLLIPDATESPLEVERLSNGSLDGVLLTTAVTQSPLPEALKARNVPFVLVNRVLDGGDYDQCTFDNIKGAEYAAAHLADLGHSIIGQICGPHDTSTGQERDKGFRQALAKRGIAVPGAYLAYGPYSFDHGFVSAHRFLSSENPPTAIFCGNDVIAIGALNALKRLQRDHPRLSVEIVGFDDIKMASWGLINITTVHGDLSEMARSSVQLMLNRIEHPDSPPQQKILPTRLIIR